ncbi:hypothetical protein [Paenibacillus contaminans]|uniref:hypothetical protein n=1 Tax=Paenibacillus contaminans TaxID=450362 RepID=UPI0018644216|nr:hypothetical protein [Paenibacillus contaminans]
MKLTPNLNLKKPEGTDVVDINDLNGNADILDAAVTGKIDKVAGKGLSTEDYTTVEKNKLAGITAGAQVNTVTSVAGKTGAVTLAKADVGLGNVDNVQQAPITHVGAGGTAHAAATTSAAGFMSAADKSKLDGVATGANNYTHPATHPPSIIAQDASNRFVTDAEKANWNGKVSKTGDTMTGALVLPVNAAGQNVPVQTTGNLTYYVRTDGNDANTGLSNTSGGALKTIQAAIDKIPHAVNHNVTINVADGTYPAQAWIDGFTGKATIIIRGNITTSANVSVQGFIVVGNSCQVSFEGMTNVHNSNACIYASRTAFVSANKINCTVTNLSSDAAFVAADGATLKVESCTISNRGTCFQAAGPGTSVYAVNNNGTGNGGLISASSGGRVDVTGAMPSATNPDWCDRGIIIRNGGAINPWGDNTTNSRSSVSAYAGSIQTFTGGVLTKITSMSNLNYDNLGEWSTTSGAFTAKQSGHYFVQFQFESSVAPPTGTSVYATANLNGAHYDLAQMQTSQTSHGLLLNGSRIMKLNAGDVISFYVGPSPSVTVSNTNAASTYCSITKIA